MVRLCFLQVCLFVWFSHKGIAMGDDTMSPKTLNLTRWGWNWYIAGWIQVVHYFCQLMQCAFLHSEAVLLQRKKNRQLTPCPASRRGPGRVQHNMSRRSSMRSTNALRNWKRDLAERQRDVAGWVDARRKQDGTQFWCLKAYDGLYINRVQLVVRLGTPLTWRVKMVECLWSSALYEIDWKLTCEAWFFMLVQLIFAKKLIEESKTKYFWALTFNIFCPLSEPSTVSHWSDFLNKPDRHVDCTDFLPRVLRLVFRRLQSPSPPLIFQWAKSGLLNLRPLKVPPVLLFYHQHALSKNYQTANTQMIHPTKNDPEMIHPNQGLSS